MNLKEHIAAVRSARAKLEQLERDSATTRAQLGAARDRVNTVCNTTDDDRIAAALADLGCARPAAPDDTTHKGN